MFTTCPTPGYPSLPLAEPCHPYLPPPSPPHSGPPATCFQIHHSFMCYWVSLPSSPPSPPWPLPFSMTLDDTVTVAQSFQATLALQTREHGSSCFAGPSGAFMILLPVTHTFLVFLLLGLLATLWTYHAPQDLCSSSIPVMPSPACHACFSVKAPTIHGRPTGNVSLSMKPWPIFPSRSDPPSLPLSGPTKTLFIPSAGHRAYCWGTR